MRSLYLKQRFFLILILLILGFIISFSLTWLLGLLQIALYALLGLTFLDILSVYRFKQGIRAQRDTNEKLSNGDENTVLITIENRYPFKIQLKAIDEIPFQFFL